MVLIKFPNSRFLFLSTILRRLKEPIIVIIENVFLAHTCIYNVYTAVTFPKVPCKILKNMFYNTLVVQRVTYSLLKKL